MCDHCTVKTLEHGFKTSYINRENSNRPTMPIGFSNITKEKKCQGQCDPHEGEVRTYTVSGHGWGDSPFDYCDTAVEEDRRNGFVVVLRETA